MRVNPDRSAYIVLDSVDSTNQYLMQAGVPSGTVCVARTQTAGRGRRGRHWHARPGTAVLFSTLLVLESDVYRNLGPRVVWFPLLAGLAVLRVAERILTESTSARKPDLWLKWPNDLYAVRDGVPGKAAGILVESSIGKTESMRVVIGAGINFSDVPEDVPDATVPPAALLSESRAEQQEPFEIFVPLYIAEFNARLSQLSGDTKVLPDFLREIRARDYLRNRLVRTGGETFAARGISDTGRLILEKDGVRTETDDAPDLEILPD